MLSQRLDADVDKELTQLVNLCLCFCKRIDRHISKLIGAKPMVRMQVRDDHTINGLASGFGVVANFLTINNRALTINEHQTLGRFNDVGRNAAGSKDTVRIDLRIDQEIPGFGRLKPKVYLKINNLLNMINSDWGGQYDSAFVGEQVVESSVNGAGQFVYEGFNTPEVSELIQNISVWEARIGLEVRF
jgi:hypothetical protein